MRTIEYWLARFAFASVALCPPLARVYVKLLDLAIPRLRRTAAKNLEIADIPDEGVIDGMYRSIARMLVTFAKLPSITRENVGEWIRYDGLENFQNAMARGRGVLVATAHLGDWELSAFAHALMTAPMHIVVRPLDNALIDALVERRRALSGNWIMLRKACLSISSERRLARAARSPSWRIIAERRWCLVLRCGLTKRGGMFCGSIRRSK